MLAARRLLAEDARKAAFTLAIKRRRPTGALFDYTRSIVEANIREAVARRSRRCRRRLREPQQQEEADAAAAKWRERAASPTLVERRRRRHQAVRCILRDARLKMSDQRCECDTKTGEYRSHDF